MKKIIVVMTLIMAFCLSSVTAFAEELNEENPSGDTTVFYKIGSTDNENNPDDPTDDEISGTYAVQIPAYIEAASKQQVPVTQDVIAKNVMIPYGTTLNVSVEYEKMLKLKDNTDITVGYTLQADNENIEPGSVVVSVPAGTPESITKSAIGGVLTEDPAYAGVYSNIATFAISVA